VATLREIRRRIGGIKSIEKITNAMKMVAAAKLRRAQENVVAIRPYARKIRQLIQHTLPGASGEQHPLLAVREVKNALVVAVASDRGLCGSFNNNLVKAVLEHVRNTYPGQGTGVQYLVVGKKSSDYFRKRNYPIFAAHPGIFHSLQFQTARDIVREFSDAFLQGRVDRVDVVYNEFKSVIQQRIVVEQLLPVLPETVLQDAPPGSARADYIFEPSQDALLRELLPKHLDIQMMRVLLESNAAEQGARMTAMGNATDNAGELISMLTLSYNKARQSSITKELLEIVSGAEALKKAG